MDIEKDKFNSSIFKLKMGNVFNVKPNIDEKDVENIMNKARDLGFQHLNVKIGVENKDITNLFLNHGFMLVDTQIMYEISLKSNKNRLKYGGGAKYQGP